MPRILKNAPQRLCPTFGVHFTGKGMSLFQFPIFPADKIAFDVIGIHANDIDFPCNKHCKVLSTGTSVGDC